MGKSDKPNKRKSNKQQESERKESDGKQKLRFEKGEKQRFVRFATAARKVGLLVSKDAYLRYFRDPAEVRKKE